MPIRATSKAIAEDAPDKLGGLLATILAVVRMKLKPVTAKIKQSGPCRDWLEKPAASTRRVFLAAFRFLFDDPDELCDQNHIRVTRPRL
jgi:hypothetical protein